MENQKSVLGEPGQSRVSWDRVKSNWATPRAGACFQKTKSCLFETCDWVNESLRLKSIPEKAIWITLRLGACLKKNHATGSGSSLDWNGAEKR